MKCYKWPKTVGRLWFLKNVGRLTDVEIMRFSHSDFTDSKYGETYQQIALLRDCLACATELRILELSDFNRTQIRTILDGLTNTVFHKNLTKLVIRNCQDLIWFSGSSKEQSSWNLRELSLIDCPDLVLGPNLTYFPRLKKLDMSGCSLVCDTVELAANLVSAELAAAMTENDFVFESQNLTHYRFRLTYDDWLANCKMNNRPIREDFEISDLHKFVQFPNLKVLIFRHNNEYWIHRKNRIFGKALPDIVIASELPNGRSVPAGYSRVTSNVFDKVYVRSPPARLGGMSKLIWYGEMDRKLTEMEEKNSHIHDHSNGKGMVSNSE